jgi:hypothetical protein
VLKDVLDGEDDSNRGYQQPYQGGELRVAKVAQGCRGPG